MVLGGWMDDHQYCSMVHRCVMIAVMVVYKANFTGPYWDRTLLIKAPFALRLSGVWRPVDDDGGEGASSRRWKSECGGGWWLLLRSSWGRISRARSLKRTDLRE